MECCSAGVFPDSRPPTLQPSKQRASGGVHFRSELHQPVNQVFESMTIYKEIEHTADVGVEVYGNSLEELLRHAAYALFDTIVDVSTIRPEYTRSVRVNGADDESVLMNWLRELLFLFSVEEEVYAGVEIQSLQAGELHAIVKGEKLDLERHRFKTELKAVTYHQFKLDHTGNTWTARVIFDV